MKREKTTIGINIWDDYFQEGAYEEIEPTTMKIEESEDFINWETKFHILSIIKDILDVAIEEDIFENKIELKVDGGNDFAQMYIYHLSTEDRENMVDFLNKCEIRVNDYLLDFYSES